MADSYTTIAKSGESLFKDRASKFIGIAVSVSSEEDVKTAMESIKSQYPDAGHHCYALRLFHDHSLYRYSDDGEPSNSAGAPIYGQIQSYDLTNVLIVVVRYFGGTKLGVGGLINAYREAAKLAIEDAGTVTAYLKDFFEISFGYEQTSDFKQIVHQMEGDISNEIFETKCSATVSVLAEYKEDLIALLEQKQIEFTYLYKR